MDGKKYYWHNLCLKLLAVFNLLDALFTYVWVSLGYAQESNPLMDYLISISAPGFILYKVILVNLCIFILWRFSYAKLCRILVVPLTLVYAWVMYIHLSFVLVLASL